MSSSQSRCHYFSLLRLKRINYWLEKNSYVNLRVSISKELQPLKVTPRSMKNVKEMLEHRGKGR